MARKAPDSLVLLREIGETASNGGDLAQLFEKILADILQATDVEAASVLLLEEDGRLHIRAARGVPSEIVQETCIAPGEGISGYVLATGQAVLLEDLHQDGRFASSGGGERYRNRSLLSVPIKMGGRVLGVINVNNKRSGEAFVPADRELLTAISHLAALAVENAALAHRLSRQSGELETAHRRLLFLHESRGRLVCNLSHELNTPLTSMLGYLELLLHFPQRIEEAEGREFLTRAFEQSLRMERLISGMLRLFSLDGGDEPWVQAPVALDELVREALARRAADMEGYGVQLQAEIAADVAPVLGDRDKVAVLMAELVDNAIKFCRRPGALKVQLTPRDEDGCPSAYLRIYNDGESIPAGMASELFNGFTQLGDMNSGKPEGIGIGLATCRVIAERLQGKIFFEPTDDRGTAIGVLLPTMQEGSGG